MTTRINKMCWHSQHLCTAVSRITGDFSRSPLVWFRLNARASSNTHPTLASRTSRHLYSTPRCVSTNQLRSRAMWWLIVSGVLLVSGGIALLALAPTSSLLSNEQWRRRTVRQFRLDACGTLFRGHGEVRGCRHAFDWYLSAFRRDGGVPRDLRAQPRHSASKESSRQRVVGLLSFPTAVATERRSSSPTPTFRPSGIADRAGATYAPTWRDSATTPNAASHSLRVV